MTDTTTESRPIFLSLKMSPASGTALEIKHENILEFNAYEALAESFDINIIYQVLAKGDKTKFSTYQGNLSVLTITSGTPGSPGKQIKYLSGLVSEMEILPKDKSNWIYNTYKIRLVPPLEYLRNQDRFSALHLSPNGRVELVKTLYKAAFSKEAVPQTGLQPGDVYDKPQCCVRYQETLRDFIHRLLEEEGVWWRYSMSASGALLYLCNTTSYGKTHEESRQKPSELDTTMIYNPRVGQSNTIDELKNQNTVFNRLTQSFSSLPKDAQISQYTANTAALVTAKTDSAGTSGTLNTATTLGDFPVAFGTTGAGSRIAKSRAWATSCHNSVIILDTVTPFVAVGLEVTIKSVDESTTLENEGVYVPIQIKSYYNQYKGYSNRIKAIPANVPFAPLRRVPSPNMSGPFIGVVSPASGSVEKNTIVIPAADSPATNNSASCEVYVVLQFDPNKVPLKARVSLPVAGSNWGAFHVPRQGAEVQVKFTDGDVNGLPIVVGQAYNANNKPAFDWTNNKDITGYQSSPVESKDVSAQGTTPATTKVDTSDTSFPKYNSIYMDDTAGNLKMVNLAGGTYLIKSTGNVDIGCKTNITLQAINTLTLYLGTGDTPDNKMVMNKDSITIQFDANNKIVINKDGVTVNGKAITVTATNAAQIKGDSLTAEATNAATLKGKEVTVQGSTSTTIKGPEVTVSGETMTTIKGGTVMIN